MSCVTWHTNLPKYLSDNIEMIQKIALKSVFPNKGYDGMYDIGMCTLRERRNVICEQYVKNMQGNSHEVHHLLPEERCIHYDMRRENKYPLTKNRTNRYGKSFTHSFTHSIIHSLARSLTHTIKPPTAGV